MTQTSDTGSMIVSEITANPAPLGLLGFGMTTVLLNLHNAGLFTLGSMILAMGLCYGGTAQIIAGIMEWKKNNTFGMTAFLSYGLFWISLVMLLLLPAADLADGIIPHHVGDIYRNHVHRNITTEQSITICLWLPDYPVLPPCSW